MAPKGSDAQWVANLSNHRVGRQLANHLASVEGQSDVHAGDCAAQEALWNERVLVHALARSINRQKPLPCGLSSRIPMFIAVLNLSGERSLVGSDSPALIRVLCTRSTALHRSELKQALKMFEDHAAERIDAALNFVILTYSMPWQSGTDSVYWRLSACAINTTSKPDLVDRIKHFSSTSLGPCTGKSVMDMRDATLPIHGTEQGALKLVDNDQIDAFCESYSATNLDKDPTTIATATAAATAATGSTEATSGAEGNELRMLRSVIDDLHARSKQDQAEINNQKKQLKLISTKLNALVKEASKKWDDMEGRHKAQLDKEQQKAKEELDRATEKNSALLVEIEGLETTKKQQHKETRKHKATAEALQAKQAADGRQSAAKDALHNAALSQHVATISRLEGLLATSGEKAAAARAELERSHAETVRSEREAHAAALQKLTIALQSKERICNQLSENNERRDVEVESHKTHQAEQDKRIVDLEAQLGALSHKLNARPKPVATRNASIGTRKNASTSTHQCAQTQTDRPPSPERAGAGAAPATSTEAPPPLEAAVALVGTKVTDRAPSPSLSYQGALDMLQELVTASGNACVPQVVPMHHAPMSMPMPMPMQMPMPMPMPYSGYPRPLPYPHFVPGATHHERNGYGHAQPRHAPSQRKGSRQ